MSITDSTPTKVNGHAVPPVRFEKFTIPSAPANLVDNVNEVVEGEVVQDRADPLRPPLYYRVALRVRRATTHPKTRTAGVLAVRHSLYVGAGARVLSKRAWESRTTARHMRMVRTAEELGQHEVAAEWEAKAAAFRASRHQRRMDLLHMPARLAKALLVSLAVGAGSLFLLGVVLAIAQKDIRDLWMPAAFAIALVRDLVFIGAVVWNTALVVGPVLLLAALWRAGKQGGSVPRWVLPERERTVETITPSVVVLALRDLGISQLRKQIQAMADGAAGMLGPITIAGCGVEVDVTLPTGVSTEEIQGRRRKLAENMGRHEHELHISLTSAARTVRLWIADAGALEQPIGLSPLVTDTTLTSSYEKGRAPWGVDLRGDQIAISLYQRHLLVTGLSNQGKTFAVRSLALWLALDPTVELRIADLKGAGDWACFGGIAAVLIEGPTDDHVAQATEMLEEGVQEMNRRLTSPPGTTWKPLVLVVDEAQVAYMCPEKDANGLPYGGKSNLSRFLRAVRYIHNQGRKVDVLLWEGTQDPTDQNLPKLAREGAHIRAGLAVGTESQARMAIGDKAMDSKGASPHLLRQGIDKGTLVVAPGDAIPLPAGVVCTTVRTYFIDHEPADQIADRARELRSGVTTLSKVEPTVRVDPLQDIATVIGEELRVVTQEVLRRLVELNAGYYKPWTFATLTQYLAEFGAEPIKSNRMVVDRQRVLDALASRDAGSDEDANDDSE